MTFVQDRLLSENGKTAWKIALWDLDPYISAVFKANKFKNQKWYVICGILRHQNA